MSICKIINILNIEIMNIGISFMKKLKFLFTLKKLMNIIYINLNVLI